MKLASVFAELERGKVLPLYYFYGPEKWLADEAVRKIKEKTLSPGAREFNYQVFDGESDALETILEGLQFFPVQSPRRLVVIRRADSLWKEKSAALNDYLQDPNPLTCALFIGEKADLRNRFFQLFEQKGMILPCYPPSEREMDQWIRFQAQEKGHRISAEAVALLVERIGPSLQELSLEIQKLALKSGSGEIQEEDVAALTDDVRSLSPFELPRAVGHLDLPQILRLVKKNIQQGDSPLLLFSLVVRQLRMIRRAKELKNTGASRKEVEAKLRIIPRFAEDFWRQVEGFPAGVLDQLWVPSLRAEQSLKSSRMEKGLLLERYLLNLFFLTRGRLPNPFQI